MDTNSIAQDQINRIKEKCEIIRPLVVILCITYNHERYIRDALEGFVMQKTDFPFVAIVHDDASTDKTAEIIKEYAEGYPNIILPIYEEENQYSKRKRGVGIIMDAARRVTGAKYVALCEGDDYWIDPLKLQKQVNFLNNNPEYGFVHTNIYITEWSSNFEKKTEIHNNVPNGNVYQELLERNFICTASVLYRTDLVKYFEKEVLPIPAWDRIMWICFSRHTKFQFLSDITTVYRVLKNSATHGDYRKVLNTEFIGTSDLLQFLRNNNISQSDIDLFYFYRSKKILRLCYYAQDKNNLNKYWGIIKKLGKPDKKDYIYWAFGNLGIPSPAYENLSAIWRIMKKPFQIFKIK